MDTIEYRCSAGHAIATTYELDTCLVHGCKGTLTRQGHRGRPKKQREPIPKSSARQRGVDDGDDHRGD